MKKIKGGIATAFKQEFITFHSWHGREKRREKRLMKVWEKARIKHSRLGSRPRSVRIVTEGKPGAKSEVARKGLGTCSVHGKTQSKHEAPAVPGPTRRYC